MRTAIHEFLIQASYFAPRGKSRLIELGSSISHRYLDPMDRLIGLVGDAGAGKSLLIRGMFPGLELTNDDNGINLRPLPLQRDAEDGYFKAHTYHVDVRFEAAFNQLYEIAEAVKSAIACDRRVVLEHFDLLYPILQINAEVLIGVGEEVLVSRPGAFGPYPPEIAQIVFRSLRYRKMAHSAEDLTARVLTEMGVGKPADHSDVRHGFALEFAEKPDIDLYEVERLVLKAISEDQVIKYHDECQITIGDKLWSCTGPRLHVLRTGDIKGFGLIKEFKWDSIANLYILAGLIGEDQDRGVLTMS